MNKPLTGRYDRTFRRHVIAPKSRGILDYFATDDGALQREVLNKSYEDPLSTGRNAR